MIKSTTTLTQMKLKLFGAVFIAHTHPEAMMLDTSLKQGMS